MRLSQILAGVVLTVSTALAFNIPSSIRRRAQGVCVPSPSLTMTTYLSGDCTGNSQQLFFDICKPNTYLDAKNYQSFKLSRPLSATSTSTEELVFYSDNTCGNKLGFMDNIVHNQSLPCIQPASDSFSSFSFDGAGSIDVAKFECIVLQNIAIA